MTRPDQAGDLDIPSIRERASSFRLGDGDPLFERDLRALSRRDPGGAKGLTRLLDDTRLVVRQDIPALCDALETALSRAEKAEGALRNLVHWHDEVRDAPEGAGRNSSCDTYRRAIEDARSILSTTTGEP